MTRTVLLILTGLLAAAPAQDTLYINGTADGKPKRLVIQDGKVVWNADPAKLAAGGSRTIDGAFIYPGLVRADSGHLVPLGADAAAVNPEICAGDGYDPFTPRPTLTASGITSVYVSPGRSRFVPGCGSVIQVGAEALDAVAVGRSALHIVVTPEAYNPPDIFKPAIPPGPDNPHALPQRQFPRSRAGAFAALRQVFDEAARLRAGTGPARSELPGRPKLEAFVEVLDGKRILRVRAERANDISGVLAVVGAHAGVRLVIEGGTEAWKVAKELAAAKAGVILRGGTAPSGKLPAAGPFQSARGDAHPGAAEALRLAGVTVAVVPPTDGADDDLVWYALQSSLTGADAMAAVTTNAAKLIGLDAKATANDYCVFDRDPTIHPEARPVVVISKGAVIHDLTGKNRPVAILAKRVYTAKGDVIENGTVVVQGKKIIAVGTDVVIPNGARRMRVDSVMPGMIDAGGQIGFRSIADAGDAGLRRGPALGAQSMSKRLSEMFDPQYPDVRPVAESGVTTMAITPSGGKPTSGVLSIVKTSGADREQSVVRAIGGLLFDLASAKGNATQLSALKTALKNGKKYRDSWTKYDKAFAAWKKKNPTAKVKKPARQRRVGKVKPPTLSDPLTGTWEGTMVGLGDEDARCVFSIRLKDEKAAGTVALENVLAEAVKFKDVDFQDQRLTIKAEVEGVDCRFLCAVSEDRLSVSWREGDVFRGFATLRRTSEIPSHEEAARDGKVKKPAAGKKASTSKSKDDAPPKKPKESASLEPFRALLGAEIPVFLGIADDGLAEKAIKMLRDEYECTTVVISSVGMTKFADELADNGCGYAPAGNPVARVKGKRVVTALEAVRKKIPVALRSGWGGDGRTLYAAASHAVRCGVKPADAMKMVTYWSALILNVADRVGAIAAGLDADLLIVKGSAFAPGSRVERVMIDGRFIDETGGDRQ